MDSPEALIATTDWSELSHAYGPASDAPFQLLALLSGDLETRSAAAGYLDVAILHQGSICPATGPVALVVAAMLDDPRTLEPVENVLPWDAAPRPLRLELLDFLARVSESCMFDTEETLQADAHPPGRTEAELLQISADADEALRSLGPDPSTRMLIDRVPAPEALATVANDKEYQRAIRARHILSCQTVLPKIFAALLPIFEASDARIRVKALEAAARLIDHPDLVGHKAMVTERLETAATSCTDPARRAAAARLLGMIGATPRVLLHDDHPGVRACAALAPTLADDRHATKAILDALLAPEEADHWFEEHLPGQEGWLRFDLIWAAVERADDFEELLPAALAVLAIGKAGVIDKDIGSFVTAAFPRPYRDGDSLTAAQQTYVAALIDHEHLWRAATSRAWFRRTGLPVDRDACRELLASSSS